MKGYTEHAFTELGYLQDRDVEAIKALMQGRSFMHFDIRSSNYAGNHTLVVSTTRPDTTEDELKGMFLFSMALTISEMYREIEAGRPTQSEVIA